MQEEHINIAEVCKSNTVTRDHGKVIHDLIAEKWNSADVIKIDFNNILIASVSFLDEAFGNLAEDYTPEQISRKLKLVNIKDFDRNLANNIYRSRLSQK